MIPSGNRRKIVYTKDVKREISQRLEEMHNLDKALGAIEQILRLRPEHPETDPIPGEHDGRLFARKPKFDPGVPGVTLLYDYDDETVEVWGIRVETFGN